jgi:hypothetical protein
MTSTKQNLIELAQQECSELLNPDALKAFLDLIASNAKSLYVDKKELVELEKQQNHSPAKATRSRSSATKQDLSVSDGHATKNASTPKIYKQRVGIPWYTFLGLKKDEVGVYISTSQREDKKHPVKWKKQCFRVPEEDFTFHDEMVLPTHELVTVLCQKPLVWVERPIGKTNKSLNHVVMGLFERIEDFTDDRDRTTSYWVLHPFGFRSIQDFAEFMHQAKKFDLQNADKESHQLLTQLMNRRGETLFALYRDFVSDQVTTFRSHFIAPHLLVCRFLHLRLPTTEAVPSLESPERDLRASTLILEPSLALRVPNAPPAQSPNPEGSLWFHPRPSPKHFPVATLQSALPPRDPELRRSESSPLQKMNRRARRKPLEAGPPSPENPSRSVQIRPCIPNELPLPV